MAIDLYPYKCRLNNAQFVLSLSDADLTIGSLPVDDEPDVDIQRPAALPDGKNATITIGDSVESDDSHVNVISHQELRSRVKAIVKRDLTKYDTQMRLATVRLSALVEYANVVNVMYDHYAKVGGMEHWILNAPINIISHLTGIFTTYITRGLADFKRSEITEYIQSNRASVWQVRRVALEKIRDLKFELPIEINAVRLPEVYRDIKPFLVECDLRGRTKKLITLLGKINKSRDGHVDGDMPQSLDDGILAVGKNATTKYLAKNLKKSASFVEIYSNAGSFSKFIDELVDADNFFFAIAATYKELETADSTIKQVIKKISPDSAKSLSVLIKNFAELVTTYGECITMLNILQHIVTSHIDSIRTHISA